MRRFRPAIFAILTMLLAVPAARAGEAADQASASLRGMVVSAHGLLEAHTSPETGTYDFIRVTGDTVIAVDDASAKPEARALAFLRSYGAALGMSEAERASIAGVLRRHEVYRDAAGNTHVRLDQVHRGVPVTGGQLVVHMNRRGITGVNGTFVPGIAVPRTARVSQTRARAVALDAVAKVYETTKLAAEAPHLTVYRSGLGEGRTGTNSLAWEVTVTGQAIRDRVWVDATRDVVLSRMETIEHARDRVAYSPQYDPDNPDRFAHRREGQGESHIPPVDKLFDFTGQVYDLFSKTFGRDSFDGKGRTMRTVYLINEVCPNAYWNSSTTNYCPGFDLDDVVAHEWGHAYTEYTHGLHYLCQPGALNESYSDIWGETIDLLNGMDGIGGANNDAPYPGGQRWLVGEDLGRPVQEALLRDMWDPERLASPGKVSGTDYVCGSADGFGVHTNSGVPNHAYAMLVDGKTYNGRTIRGIGLTKAAHIYYQAMTAYQTHVSGFAVHDQALKASCRDLTGVDLKELMTGAASGKRITADDCAQVSNVTAAVELAKPPVQCGFKPLLSTEPQPVCPAARVVYNETWESGSDGWTLGTEGTTQDFPGTKWKVGGALPKGRSGHAMYAEDPLGGVCLESRGNWSGRYWADSPERTIPAGLENVTLRFDHYVATESADGGNVYASVNGGAFALLTTYVFNGPNGSLPASTPVLGGNTNPKAGQAAWFGADPGEVTGTWATTIADLTTVAKAGDKIRLRFDFGIDQCGGIEGWYVDDIAIYSCPVLPPPTVSVREYTNPDPDRAVTLAWNRPAGGIGPDEVQRFGGTRTVMTEDAESGLTGWTAEATSPFLGWESSNGTVGHGSKTFFAKGSELAWIVFTGRATLARNDPVAIPAVGEATLTFKSWAMNEPDDLTTVDVSTDNGKEWKPVWKQARAAALQAQIPALLEPLTPVSVNLSEFAGKTIRIRLSYIVGPTNYVNGTPLGWHVDDLSIQTLRWDTVAKPAVASARLANLVDGSHTFRVRTSYRNGFGTTSAGPWSESVSVAVRGRKPVVQGGTIRPPLPATGVGVPDAALLLLVMSAVLVRMRRPVRMR